MIFSWLLNHLVPVRLLGMLKCLLILTRLLMILVPLYLSLRLWLWLVSGVSVWLMRMVGIRILIWNGLLMLGRIHTSYWLS